VLFLIGAAGGDQVYVVGGQAWGCAADQEKASWCAGPCGVRMSACRFMVLGAAGTRYRVCRESLLWNQESALRVFWLFGFFGFRQ
jgi:hypothetical protein